jgi:ubiquitin-activating enzyme E1
LVDPEYFITDFAKFDRLAALHYGFQALSAFRDKHGRLPAPRSSVDADEVLAIAKGLTKEELSEDIVRELAFQAKGDVSPMNAVIGGFVAQEVIKACSAKFHPMKQHMYFDSLESLPASKPTEADCQPLKTRYDGQIAVFGRTFHETIANHKQFLVGSGAIGCEMLKNWAMMGVGTGPNGKIHVTDLDTIEKSNLNRQFLFRPKDIGKFKSEAAAQAVTDMNPDMRGHVNCRQDPVGPETEGECCATGIRQMLIFLSFFQDTYGDDFFAGIDGVTNALDNLKARECRSGK